MKTARKCFGDFDDCPIDDECCIPAECSMYGTALRMITRLKGEIEDLKSQKEGM